MKFMKNMKKIIVCFCVFAFLNVVGYCAAESRSEIYPEKEIVFVDEGEIVTLSLGRYDGGEGVITSPDKSLKGLPYVIGAMKYDYGQPYVFTRNNHSSQAVLIPYTYGSGTGLAIRNWCIALVNQKNVYIKPLGLWHYHCCGLEDNYFSFDICPSFYTAYKKDLRLFFVFEERKKGESRIVKGDITLNITNTETNVEISFEPYRVEDALGIAELLTAEEPINEWAFECLSQAFPKMMKDFDVDGVISTEMIKLLKSKIKQHYAK